MNTDKRIRLLEAAVGKLFVANKMQKQTNERLQLEYDAIVQTYQDKIDHVYGRDEEIGNNFQAMVDRYEKRVLAVEDQIETIEELLEIEG